MNLYSLENIPNEVFGSVIAIGNFDGIHKGHQELIKYGRNIAHKNNTKFGILTFEPHPISVFIPEKHNYRITPVDTKRKILEFYGVDILINANFNQGFSDITAENFITDILHKKLKPHTIITGEDFTFGKDRGGDKALLQSLSKKSGFNYLPHEIVRSGEIKYSSSEIRKSISEADFHKAKDFLGWDFFISGVVENGRKQGEKIGFKTANIDFKDHLIPKFGVYACNISIDSKTYKAIANIGIRPTFELQKPLLEVHIFNFNENIYGKYVEVTLNQFIRDEKKFNSIEELKNQIQIDIQKAKDL